MHWSYAFSGAVTPQELIVWYDCGHVSTRSADDLVKAMGMSGISKSQVSQLCEEIDQRAKAFPDQPIEGDWLYLWIDATHVKVRQAGRIVSVAVIVAVGVSTDGRREVLRMDIGASEAEPFWTAFPRKLARRGLRGVKLVVSAFIATAFAQGDARRAKAQWRRVADQLRPKLAKLADLKDHAEPDVRPT